MTPQEISELIELIIGDILTLEEAASIECIDPRELSRVINEVMTFKSRHSRNNSTIVRLSDFNKQYNEQK